MRINKMANKNYNNLNNDLRVSELMVWVQAALYFPRVRLGEGVVAIKTDLTREQQSSQSQEVNQSGRIIATRTVIDPNLKI